MDNSVEVKELDFGGIITRLDNVFRLISTAELDAAKNNEDQNRKSLSEFKEEALVFAGFLSDLTAGRVVFGGVVLKMINLIESFCVLIEESHHD